MNLLPSISRSNAQWYCSISLIAISMMLLPACSNTPGMEPIVEALKSQYGQLASVTDVRRTNGIDYPAGNGGPRQYAIEFEATLIPTGPVTFHISSGLEQAFSQNRTAIKSISKGLEADPQGWSVFFDIGTERWRVVAATPVTVVGEARFLNTEKGWQRTTLQTFLSDASVQTMKGEKQKVSAIQEAQRQTAVREQQNVQRGQQLIREGLELQKQKSYAAAIDRYKQAAELGNPTGANNLAWLYATCSDSSLVNAKAALDFATQAVNKFPRLWNFVGTLAAAQARNNQFDEAVKTQVQATELLRTEVGLTEVQRDKYLSAAEARLALYQQHKPYTEPE